MDALEASLLPCPLRIESVTVTEQAIVVRARLAGDEARCPCCDQPSSRMQSRYVRSLGDVPLGGGAVCLALTIRRLYCRNPQCARRIFADRLGDFAPPYARRTARLAAILEAVAFALGGEAGARLARRIGLPASPDTLLRLIRRAPDSPTSAVRICGVDDFAWRKRRRYGTALVDLERHRLIDLLPDRSATSVAAWPRQHPEITVVSRDRGGEYADGARRGAPQATQVADRFHLLRNLGDTVRRVLLRHADLVRRVRSPDSVPPALTAPWCGRSGSSAWRRPPGRRWPRRAAASPHPRRWGCCSRDRGSAPARKRSP